jgi:hypothetical protein
MGVPALCLHTLDGTARPPINTRSTGVCKVAFKHLDQPLRCHIQMDFFGKFLLSLIGVRKLEGIANAFIGLLSKTCPKLKLEGKRFGPK